ncbi:zeta toxin family protein [Microbacterium phosphatis]|uniref:zeta toxin family protein n=1 Tax=Microbacterium phosphatis TaxID=3140248 RepID=UPI0031401411
MTDIELEAAETRAIFDATIAPVLFPSMDRPETPTVTLVVGQPGAGAGRAARALLAEHPGAALLDGGRLRAFHPRFFELSRSRSPEVLRVFAEATSAWLRDCLAYARTSRRSLVLDGSFSSARVARATAELFQREGFETHVAVVGQPRAVSLLSEASRSLIAALDGRSTPFTDLAAHDAGFEVTRALVSELEGEAPVDRLTVVGRAGDWVFDARRADGFAGASRALVREQVTPMSGPEGRRWLSELRASTEFALSNSRVPAPLAEVLLELHELALGEVLPRLPLPVDSVAHSRAEATIRARVDALRQAPPAETALLDVAAPTVAQPVPGLDLGPG